MNDYTNWFAGDADMGGDYYGCDGPCPPWKTLLSTTTSSPSTRSMCRTAQSRAASAVPDVRKAIQGHVLASAAVTGTYTLNPDVKL